MIVVDTSAWVEYLRKTGSPTNTVLKRALEAEDELGVVDVVRMELLTGAGSDEQVVTVPGCLREESHSPRCHRATTSTRRACTGPSAVPARRCGR